MNKMNFFMFIIRFIVIPWFIYEFILGFLDSWNQGNYSGLKKN